LPSFASSLNLWSGANWIGTPWAISYQRQFPWRLHSRPSSDASWMESSQKKCTLDPTTTRLEPTNLRITSLLPDSLFVKRHPSWSPSPHLRLRTTSLPLCRIPLALHFELRCVMHANVPWMDPTNCYHMPWTHGKVSRSIGTTPTSSVLRKSTMSTRTSTWRNKKCNNYKNQGS
jgi:hypothetical protein